MVRKERWRRGNKLDNTAARRNWIKLKDYSQLTRTKKYDARNMKKISHQ